MNCNTKEIDELLQKAASSIKDKNKLSQAAESSEGIAKKDRLSHLKVLEHRRSCLSIKEIIKESKGDPKKTHKAGKVLQFLYNFPIIRGGT